MFYTSPIRSTLVLAGALLALGVYAGEAVPPADGADAKTKALEERVKTLEKRLSELEAQIKEAPAAPRFNAVPPNGIADILDQMRREMEQNGAMDRFNLFGQGPAVPGFIPNNKPSLGVVIAEVNDELKTRFKNDVKDGAFVTTVLPNSAAEKAGIAVGDAITSFDEKPIANPSALIDAVRSAAKGAHDIVVVRHSEMLKFKVELAAPAAAANDRTNDALRGNRNARTEIHVSALELSDDLAKDLKLSDDQKKKMADVLATHTKALRDEFRNSYQRSPHRDPFGFSMPGGLTELANKHVDAAAKDLAPVLNAEQLKKWNDYRAAHSNISFSHTSTKNDIGADDLKDDDEDLRF